MNQLINEYPSGMSASGRPAKQPRTPFGQRMAGAREKAGLRQVQLAGKFDITQPVVAYWEREPFALRPEQIHNLAKVHKASIDELMGAPAEAGWRKGTTGKSRQFF